MQLSNLLRDDWICVLCKHGRIELSLERQGELNLEFGTRIKPHQGTQRRRT
jgi:hypothetical protein